MNLKSFLFASVALCFTVLSFGQNMEERVSPPDTVKGETGGVEIQIAYSQPSVKGRTIWGDLVPYGKMWRAGANEATVVTFSKVTEINGKLIKPGKYAFFLIPQENESWTAIFNSEWKQWGAYKHDSKKDVLRVACTPTEHAFTEQMKFEIGESQFTLYWDNLAVPINVAAK